jgi:two-component system response regulator (stage 0 sporulation protein F)
VSAAFSGEEALDQLSAGGADVILLDILLPGLSGIEVLKHAKALHPEARVIMVTGLDQDELRAQTRHYGAAAYITKPFDFSDETWSSVLA